MASQNEDEEGKRLEEGFALMREKDGETEETLEISSISPEELRYFGMRVI